MKTETHDDVVERYLVDSRGEPRAVVIGIRAYRTLRKRLEDLEDSLALKRAVGSARSFISHERLTHRLRRKGRL